MALKVCIVGDSGQGKSHATKHLDPKETGILKCIKKHLPYRGSSKIYSGDTENMLVTRTWTEVIGGLKMFNQMPHIKNVVIDDLGHIMINEALSRIKEPGFNKFSEIALHMTSIFNEIDEMRDDLRVACNFHVTRTLVDGYKPSVKIKTIGKILESWYVIEELFDVVLYTDVHFESKKPKYGYITEYTDEAPAKSPEGMFEEKKIDNNLNFVFDTLGSYYN